jgi:phospholipid/cholesterol/gamma-HCH transport system ATP-binding protein
MDAAPQQPVIRVGGLAVAFGDRTVLENLSLDVERGEILGVVGASGAGKSVLLRTLLGLIPKSDGTVHVLGIDLSHASAAERHSVGRRCGTLFQQGALFSSLSLIDNVQFPMREYLHLSDRLRREVAMAKIEMVGLDPNDCDKYPSELSGGMTKRAALARALALDPEILFLDEPTSGLDNIAADEFDNLIRTLRCTLGLTVFMVTHDLESVGHICDRVAAIADKRVVYAGSLEAVLEAEHPWVKEYFGGPRARAALAAGAKRKSLAT